MSKAKRKTDEPRPLIIEGKGEETERESMARAMIEPYLRHGAVTSALSEKMIGKLPGEPRLDDFGKAMQAKGQEPAADRLTLATETMMAQALSLDAIFTEYARRATVNVGEYINASERYMRLALKAQSSSRATFEALVRLHQPREQTVKHVHVNDGGQAVVADNFHQHTGGAENGKSNEQSHATDTARRGGALPSPDAQRDGVPIPGGEREKALQNARRD